MLRRLSGQRTRGKCGVGVSILALGMSETHKARPRFVLCEEPGGAVFRPCFLKAPGV